MGFRIFWFRRDLRLDDNHGLYQALCSDEKVIPVFIFDPQILNKLPKNDARVNFIHKALSNINMQLNEVNSSLGVYHGNPIDIFKELIAKHKISEVYTNHDYEPYSIKRDQEVAIFLNKNNIHFKSFKDQVIFEKNEITKDDLKPYVVYTPYFKKWYSKFLESKIYHFPSENKKNHFHKNESLPFLSLSDIGFIPSQISVPEYCISDNIINEYEEFRNFPSVDKTSKTGIYSRFGLISIRKLVLKANKSNNKTFLKELVWREFFMQILWHFPHTVDSSFKAKYEAIPWINNQDQFQKWCTGQTGYPIVDAGMRELNQTGFMHNRVRMLVASFLCKHLLIDWKWGERYFAEKLLDFELSSNIGNWQWASGSGVDAAPYFRIFNPTEQTKRFDKNLDYINKWVPDLNDLNYPEPIVDHKTARQRCLTTYKHALDNYKN